MQGRHVGPFVVFVLASVWSLREATPATDRVDDEHASAATAATDGGAVCTGDPAGEPESAIVSAPWDVAAADVNGDGNVDLVVAQGGADGGAPASVRLLLNTGDSVNSHTWQCIPLPSPSASERLAVGDVDGDGKLDVVVAGLRSRSVSWWLLGAGQTVRRSGQLTVPVSDATTTSASCAAQTSASVWLSSISFADMDGSGQPLVSFTFYDSGLQQGQPCFNRVDYRYDLGSQTLAFTQKTPGVGMMRGRFVDVDGDDRLDFVGSVFAMQCLDGGSPSCGNDGVWGWFYPAKGDAGLPLPQAVGTATDAGVPPLTAVDFDVVPAGLGARTAGFGGSTAFGVAMTSFDSCKAASCWTPSSQGGYSTIVAVDGGLMWSSADAERSTESEAGTDRFLSPESLTFVDGMGAGSIAAAYRWSEFCETCASSHGGLKNFQVTHLDGAMMTCANVANGQAAFSEVTQGQTMLRIVVVPGAAPTERVDEQPLRGPIRIYYLDRRNVLAVDHVSTISVDGGAAALDFSWYPGDAWITLHNPPAGGTLRVAYRAADSPVLVVADQSAGLVFQQFD